MALGKPQRQHRIARLLEEQVISSQVQLVELLATEGLNLTQATVSRDLEELGAVKVRIPGGAMAYAIPELAKDRVAPEEVLRKVLGEFLVEAAHSANLARRAETFCPPSGGGQTTRTVSSPATVPRTSDRPARSMAEATTWAEPGGVRRTARLAE